MTFVIKEVAPDMAVTSMMLMWLGAFACWCRTLFFCWRFIAAAPLSGFAIISWKSWSSANASPTVDSFRQKARRALLAYWFFWIGIALSVFAAASLDPAALRVVRIKN